MKIKSKLFGFFIISILLSSCSQPADDAIEFTEIDGDKVPIILVDQIADRTQIKLSDWAENLKLIPLETNDQSTFDYTMRVYVGEEYIIISTVSKGILQFDQDGKFVRNLAPHGKGPGEVMDANRNIFVDEKNDRLYVTDFVYRSNQLLSYDINSNDFK